MERKKKIKDKNEILFKFIFLGAIIFFFILIIAFAVYFNSKNIPELTQGNSAQEFCSDKCGNDVYSSNKNSDFDFIRCECIVKIGPGTPSYTRAAAPSIKTEVLFFDSISFEELTKDEVLERIK